MKTKYVPWMEVIQFASFSCGSFVLLYILELSYWSLLPFLVLSYLFTMRDAAIIALSNTTLTIVSFNLFVGKHLVPLDSIILVNSKRNLQDETHDVYGAPFLTLRTRYELQYTDKIGKTKLVRFSFSNNRKEKLIMGTLIARRSGNRWRAC
jgi:hypothetical protein